MVVRCPQENRYRMVSKNSFQDTLEDSHRPGEVGPPMGNGKKVGFKLRRREVDPLIENSMKEACIPSRVGAFGGLKIRD